MDNAEVLSILNSVSEKLVSKDKLDLAKRVDALKDKFLEEGGEDMVEVSPELMAKLRRLKDEADDAL